MPSAPITHVNKKTHQEIFEAVSLPHWVNQQSNSKRPKTCIKNYCKIRCTELFSRILVFGPLGMLLCFNIPKCMEQMHSNISFMCDYWANPVDRFLLHQSSLCAGLWATNGHQRPFYKIVSFAKTCLEMAHSRHLFLYCHLLVVNSV